MSRCLSHLMMMLIVCAHVFVTGCDPNAKHKEAVHITWTTMKNGCDGNDGPAVVKSLTRDSIEHYGRVRKLAMDASEIEVLKQPMTTMGEIIEVRTKATRKDIEKLDAAGYVAFAVSKGWWAGSLEGLEITDVKVAGDFADASMYYPELEKEYRSDSISRALSGRRTRLYGTRMDKPPRYPVRFVKEADGWKFDELSMLPHWDKEMIAAAAYERMHPRAYIESMIESQEGIEVPKSAWQPMKK